MKWPTITYTKPEKGRYVKRCYLTVEQKRELLKKAYEIVRKWNGKKNSEND